jgi:hypothetical protein
MKMAHCLVLNIFLSFGVELGLDKRSVDGFEDDPLLGIKTRHWLDAWCQASID